MLNFSLAMLSLSFHCFRVLFASVYVCLSVCCFVTLIRILSIYICTTTKRILLTRDYLETRFSKQTTAHFRVARPLLQTTVDRRRPIIAPALHLLLILILTLLLLILMMILLGMMIVTAANRTAGEKLLQLTAATASFRLTCSAAACPIAALHFQLLAQLRVVVQIEVQVAADRGNGDGVRDGRGNRISQTSSYFGHRGRGRLGCRRLLLLLQQRSAVGSDVSRARWTVGEMIDQQRRGRGRRRVAVLAVRRRRLLQQQLGCDWCRRCWQLVVVVLVVQGGRRRKRTARGRGCRVELLWCCGRSSIMISSSS